MSRISNGMIVCLNVITILVAFTAIGFALWFHVRSDTDCQRVLKTPLLAVGGALLTVSVAGLVGAWCGISFLLWLYLFVLFALILALVAFTAFAIVVTNQGVGRAISGKGFGDHRLGDYSGWLKRYVVNDKNWAEIRSCLVGVKLCERPEFYEHELSPIMSGCCKPPNDCRLKSPKTGDPDCKVWSDVPTELCFECESCKAAVLYNIKREWKVLAIINGCILAVVVTIYSIGCCALRNNRYGYKRHKGHP
ncbi:Tetraspanin-8 [Striga hermonthica]|uniref:Tetraspanin-8 n=1 Tax=Striga hermonthica TaxID=68872 RepID=A0A9N7RF21_STRHE|nr:Tetraspanin-8 [Striga hermonthica]